MDPVAVLGHEVRNLVATFLGFTELLLNHDWPPERQREYLETMRDEGVRVSQFLNDLLDLQRMEAGAAAVKPRQVDLGQLLRCAAAVAAHDREHPVLLDCPDDLPAARAEPDRIQQVLANLVSNARKYSPKGGQIRLSSRAAGGFLVVSVEDSGLGIPQDALDQVFEKFFRLQGLSHRSIRGTGLGLAICRQIIEAHGGRIWAESAGLGHGARFSFTLPITGVRGQRSRAVAMRPRRETRASTSRASAAPLPAKRITAVHVLNRGCPPVRICHGALAVEVSTIGLPGAASLHSLHARNSVRGARSVRHARLHVPGSVAASGSADPHVVRQRAARARPRIE